MPGPPAEYGDSAATARRGLEECRRDGLLVGVGGRDGNAVRIAPMTEAEATEALDIPHRALASHQRPVPAGSSATAARVVEPDPGLTSDVK